ncbi:MAG: amino acid ABC transporter substrate-binding protein, partial [Rhodospirillaceae bacterium]
MSGRAILAVASVVAGLSLHMALSGPVRAQGVLSGIEARATDQLSRIQARGLLECGVNGSLVGFSSVNLEGAWVGFDTDYCRALAAAVLGQPELVQFTALTPGARLPALQNGDVDVLFRNTTLTFSRDTALGLNAVGVTYYDGQQILARRDLGVTRARDLPEGTSVCVQNNSTSRKNIERWNDTNGMDLNIRVFNSTEEAEQSLFAGRCDAHTGDGTGLSSILAVEAPRPEDFILLEDVLSKEPLGPYVREGDERWFNIVRWLINGLVAAEEQGLTQAIAQEVEASGALPDGVADTPINRRLMGLDPGFGESLGLDDAWLRRAIAAEGNYGELFERNFGPDGLG